MENSKINQQNWKNFLYYFNIPHQIYKTNQVITIQPNTSPQYEVLTSYLEELEVSELESHLIIPFNMEFPSTIYQEILTEHLLHYPIK